MARGAGISGRRMVRALCIALPLALFVGTIAHGQPAAPAPDSAETLQKSLRRSTLEQSRLTREIEGLTSDRQRLSAELVRVAARVRAAEDEVAGAERRLQEISRHQNALRRSLAARRGTVAAVLAALQRLGRSPAPAVLVRPDDILQAIRASIVLGTLTPELQAEARALAGDLASLGRLSSEAEIERNRLAEARDAVGGERERLAALIAARQGQIDLSREALTAERQRAAAIAGKARSLQDLIERSEDELSGSARAVLIARNSPPPLRLSKQAALSPPEDLKDAARLAPRVPFTETRGSLVFPVNGAILRGFGAPDGVGGQEKGVVFATTPGAIVTAPADGSVLFAGPYRSYGQLLILNAGSGYHLVLAGMERISVEIGQFVLAGEPVGSMGAPVQPRSESEVQGSPLYIEFRKDGASIDPAPWWTRQAQGEKARG